MGHLFHPRRVDHGIDGHIDLVEPGSGAVLNLTLLIQSKAQDRRFSGETDDAFHYVCDQRDLDHWPSGNSPVILVFSHPESDEAWWTEVKAAFPDAVSRAKRGLAYARFGQDSRGEFGRLDHMRGVRSLVGGRAGRTVHDGLYPAQQRRGPPRSGGAGPVSGRDDEGDALPVYGREFGGQPLGECVVTAPRSCVPAGGALASAGGRGPCRP